MDTNGFANDLVIFRDRDDVLTLLIHLGYGGDLLLVGIAYDRNAKEEQRKHTCVIEKIFEKEYSL